MIKFFNCKWLRRLPFAVGDVEAITIFPFIFVYYARFVCPRRVLKHEQVHIRQQLCYLILFFYIRYLLEYAWYRWIKKQIPIQAYHSISFEREAYAKEKE